MELAPPIGFAILTWWLGTGVILYLDGLAPRTYRTSMAGATVLALAAVVGIGLTVEVKTVTAAYVSFACGLMLWAWLEMAFLMGCLCGPRREPCSPDAHGWERTKQAIQTILYYEAAIIVVGAVLIAVSWGQANQTGAWTFFLLFAMRISAKLNVFLGVRNLSEEFLPDHLDYLASYFRRRPMNGFFPFSLTASVAVLWFLIEGLLLPSATAFDLTAHAFLATLMGLAILEHIFMVLPLPMTGLWNWSLQGRDDTTIGTPAPKPAEQTSNR